MPQKVWKNHISRIGKVPARMVEEIGETLERNI